MDFMDPKKIHYSVLWIYRSEKKTIMDLYRSVIRYRSSKSIIYGSEKLPFKEPFPSFKNSKR